MRRRIRDTPGVSRGIRRGRIITSSSSRVLLTPTHDNISLPLQPIELEEKDTPVGERAHVDVK